MTDNRFGMMLDEAVKMEKDKSTVTMSTEGSEPVTISGNKFHQLANSYGKPKKPCRYCGGLKFTKTELCYWVCAICKRLAGWRKGDEK